MKHGLFRELKRRHVYRVAVAYAVVGWLLIEVVTQVFPYFQVPDWSIRLLVLLVVTGFPIAIILAWAFELTPEGVRRTEPADSLEARAPAQHRRIGRALNAIIIGVLVLAVGLLAWRVWTPRKAPLGRTPAAAAASSNMARSSSAPATTSITIPAKSIAVLPLANDSGDKSQQYFSDGLSENLIIALSQFPGLKVIGRDSSFRFRHTTLNAAAIGRELGVAHLLEGSVQHADNEVRISAELINTADGSTLWSHHYDRPFTHLFALQDAITKAVAKALKAKLLPGAHAQSDRPPSGNLEAYKAYLQGRAIFRHDTVRDFRAAAAKFKLATQLDPKYAQAWAMLAVSHTRYAAFMLAQASAQPVYAKARADAALALSLAPDLAIAHSAMGYIDANTLDWKGAMTEYRRAEQLAPEDSVAKMTLAGMLATFGHLHRAIALIRQALHTDPLKAFLYEGLGSYLLAERHFDKAEAALRSATALQPTAMTTRLNLVYLYVVRGDAAKALAEAKSISEEAAGSRETAMAMALQIGANRSAADAALEKVIHDDADGSAYQIAEIYAIRKNADQTFAWLDHAWANRDPGLQNLLHDPMLDGFKNDPRFAAFCRKIGLPPPGTAATGVNSRPSPHS